MNLHSGDLFWNIRDGLLRSYPSLDHDIKTDVLIIGAGISGALAGYYLLNKGLKVVFVDSRDIASGSTCASTCLLQYEADTHLGELIKRIGEKNAIRSYLLCRDAIYAIGAIAKKINSRSEFEFKRSLYLASKKKDVKELETEYKLRNAAGIEAGFLSKTDLMNSFGIDAPAAIISKDGAQIDAYLFTQELLSYLSGNAVDIFDKTQAMKITTKKSGVEIITDKGFKISASNLIYANGYEAHNYLDESYGSLHSTYVVASEPFKSIPYDFILWETARPYFYMRCTFDNRVIVGGMDEPFYNPERRDKLLRKKTNQLVAEFQKKFRRKDFVPDYSWTGTFADSKDGLPFIGKHKDHPFSYFSLGYGGNGITFSLIAAKLISDSITKCGNPDAKIFSFERRNA